MKRRTTMFVAAVVMIGGIAQGQEAADIPDQLTGYGPMIGAWLYEGPALEDVPDITKKGEKISIRFSWRRILEKQVVMEDWLVEYANGKSFSGKGLIGWNAADKELRYGSMNSVGGMFLGTVEFDRQAKTSTLTGKGVDAEGKEMTFQGVVTKTGKDTLTWQAKERTGGDVEGPSPVYQFKRVKRTGKKEAK